MSGSGGNRQDNRQRGNAAQLLEKYKSMARDAQLGGDRVQTEYYLQFADHYFRVLSESRSRFDDQRRPRDDEDDDSDEEMVEAEGEGEQQGQDSRSFDDRPERREPARDRDDRPERGNRSRRYSRDDGDGDRPERAGRNNGAERMSQEPERIAVDVLPPAIGRDSQGDTAEAEETPAPRRRTRRPRAEASDGDTPAS